MHAQSKIRRGRRALTTAQRGVVTLVVLALLSGTAWAASSALVFRVSDEPGSPYTSRSKVVALTFDDGPHPTYTRQILDILDRYNVPGTFFLIGKQVRQYPRLTTRIVQRGNVAAGHTMNHRDLRGLSPRTFAYEVDSANKAIRNATGRRVTCVRPPYGSYDSGVIERLAARSIDTAMWSVDPKDWTRPGSDAIVSRTLSQLKPSSVVVLHDGGGNRSQTVAALPRIIKGVRARGYKIVPFCR